MVGLPASQIVNHPAYPYAIRSFPPTSKGIATSTSDWGFKCNIAYEVHGTGPKKILWVTGLGAVKWFWQRQCKLFGHERASEYTCLFFDIRGMGESDKPWTKYSMKMYAQDVMVLLDHVGWTGERDLHVVASSMGGMVAQELVLMIPNRIASLMLVGTGPRFINVHPWAESVKRTLQILFPFWLDSKIENMKGFMIGEKYANAADAPEETNEGAPLFETRGDRYTAEMAYLHHSPEYSHSAWLRQMVAVQGWQMPPKDLARIGDLVGRNRIMLIHGSVDKALPPVHCEELVMGLGGDGEDGVKLVMLEGCGHMPPVERQAEFAELVTNFVREKSNLGKGV